MICRGIRGATTVDSDTQEDILSAARDLLQKMIQANSIDAEMVACAIFTTSPDLNAEFPAVAARQLGWTQVAMLCGHEMAVPGSLPMCLRILLLVNTDKSSSEINHIYIKGAKNLRTFPDWGDLGK